MKKIGKRIAIIAFSILVVVATFTACDKETAKKTLEEMWKASLNALLSSLISDSGDLSSLFGWQYDSENIDQLEQSISFASASSSSLPTKVDLTAKLPPIGNQGQYGTCVAWALGYNMKTYLHAVDKNYTATDLQNPSKQFSPKDLFWSVPKNQKGSNCNGSNFEPAFDMMIARGVATLSAVPYESLGGCSEAPPSEWTANANQYKIANYRKIDFDAATVKGYLSQGRIVAIGAKLGDKFMLWDSDDVIDSETYKNQGMQHAYHAMVVAGYDDNRGARGAFKVINSWDKQWGDNGTIWVDYDFFAKSFCFCAFVASNVTANPDNDQNDKVDPEDIKSGYDLVAWELTDGLDPDYGGQRDRVVRYNVFNSGDKPITASQDWNIVYIYYDAYDANNYDILIYDYYSDDFGTLGQDGDLDLATSDPNKKPGLAANWWNHVNVTSGNSVAGTGYRFKFPYTMPSNISGSYYLVLIADGYDAIKESVEDNNYYFFTANNGDPLKITNGVITNEPTTKSTKSKGKTPERYSPSPYPTVVSEKNVNTYQPYEIKQMLIHHAKTGDLQRKIDNYLKNKKTVTKVRERI